MRNGRDLVVTKVKLSEVRELTNHLWNGRDLVVRDKQTNSSPAKLALR